MGISIKLFEKRGKKDNPTPVFLLPQEGQNQLSPWAAEYHRARKKAMWLMWVESPASLRMRVTLHSYRRSLNWASTSEEHSVLVQARWDGMSDTHVHPVQVLDLDNISGCFFSLFWLQRHILDRLPGLALLSSQPWQNPSQREEASNQHPLPSSGSSIKPANAPWLVPPTMRRGSHTLPPGPAAPHAPSPPQDCHPLLRLTHFSFPPESSSWDYMMAWTVNLLDGARLGVGVCVM